MLAVKPLRTSKFRRYLRATALILALICLGVSGGTTLLHTEDLGPLRLLHAGASTDSHAAAAAAPDTCLACQWENSLFSPQVPTAPIVFVPLMRLPVLSCSAAAHSPSPFHHTSPRAPPRLAS